MTLLDNVVPIRPASEIAAMLRKLADELEDDSDVQNVFLVIEHDDPSMLDARCYGTCECAFKAAAMFAKAARDVTP